MKTLTMAVLLTSLCFATGFTCSKNSPPATVESQPSAGTSEGPVDQSQMAAAPVNQPADVNATQEATSATPTTETK